MITQNSKGMCKTVYLNDFFPLTYSFSLSLGSLISANSWSWKVASFISHSWPRLLHGKLMNPWGIPNCGCLWPRVENDPLQWHLKLNDPVDCNRHLPKSEAHVLSSKTSIFLSMFELLLENSWQPRRHLCFRMQPVWKWGHSLTAECILFTFLVREKRKSNHINHVSTSNT